MSDLISRQDALDALKAIPDHNDGMVFETLSHALRDIELLPSAQPELKWIPVSERFPQYGEVVIVNFRNEQIGIYRLYGPDFFCADGEMRGEEE